MAPNKEIKPKSYQLNAGQTLFFGGVARFDFIQGERSSFIAYVANDVVLHRTKLEKADAFIKNMLVVFTTASSDELADFPELVRFEFSIKRKTDIVFAGLGWITVHKTRSCCWLGTQRR